MHIGNCTLDAPIQVQLQRQHSGRARRAIKICHVEGERRRDAGRKWHNNYIPPPMHVRFARVRQRGTRRALRTSYLCVFNLNIPTHYNHLVGKAYLVAHRRLLLALHIFRQCQRQRVTCLISPHAVQTPPPLVIVCCGLSVADLSSAFKILAKRQQILSFFPKPTRITPPPLAPLPPSANRRR